MVDVHIFGLKNAVWMHETIPHLFKHKQKGSVRIFGEIGRIRRFSSIYAQLCPDCSTPELML